MDRVRFGRALGYGARHAAKSLARAVDAAAAPNPQVAAHPRVAAPNPRVATTNAQPAAQAGAGSGRAGVAGRVARATAGVRRGTAQAGHLRRHVWSPLANFSSVVGLQVSGTFFALVAVFLSKGLWSTRGAVRFGLASAEAPKLYLHALAFAIFAYFAVSSFVRAYRRERRERR